jgi:hypothetical protein
MGPSFIASLITAVGLLLVWAGERIADAGTSRYVLSGAGAVAVLVVALALRGLRLKSATPTRAPVERTLLAFQALAAFALLVGLMTSDVFTRLSGTALETASPKLAGALTALWPTFLIAALLPLLFIEMAYAAMFRAPVLEQGRIAEARNGGLGLAFALVFVFSAQYVATARDTQRDLSYFRLARPGEATMKQAAALDAKVEVSLFFPPGSDVGALVESYFEELKGQAPLLEVGRYDSALEPKRSKDLNVSANGVVVLKKGERKESLFLGTEFEKARTALRSFDGDFQKRLLQVAKSRRTVYLTQGHGERTRDPVGGPEGRATVDAVYQELAGQNFEVRPLSLAEGLGVEVPKDAAVVFVVGPTQPFSKPEAMALAAYAKTGGRLFIALDPEAGLRFDDLLEPLGLSFSTDRLADEKLYARTGQAQTLADRYNVYTRTFTSHPAVNQLSRVNGILNTLGAGALEERSPHPAEIVVDFPARTPASSFNDANSNFLYDDPPEVKKAYGLVAAVSRRSTSGKAEDDLRALVVGDSDFMADVILAQARGNGLFLLDALKWLVGEDTLTGATNSELDVPLTRTRQEDALWFYGTIFVAPMLLIALGFVMRRRSGKARKPTSMVEAKS